MFQLNQLTFISKKMKMQYKKKQHLNLKHKKERKIRKMQKIVKKIKYRNFQMNILPLDQLKLLLNFKKILKNILKLGATEIKLKFHKKFMMDNLQRMSFDQIQKNNYRKSQMELLILNLME